MDWLNDLPTVTGIHRIIAIGAQRLMRGPLVFKSPYWDGQVVIENLAEYRAWGRTKDRVRNEMGAELRALEIWETERRENKIEEEQMEFTEEEIREYWREMFPSGWFWCLHCERVFGLEQHRMEHTPGNECACGALMTVDGLDWGSVRKNNSGLPESPKHGMCYPRLY